MTEESTPELIATYMSSLISGCDCGYAKGSGICGWGFSFCKTEVAYRRLGGRSSDFKGQRRSIIGTFFRVPSRGIVLEPL